MDTPVITLLSGLGTRDASAGIAKAALMRHVPGSVVVDISHHVTHGLPQAVYVLLSAYAHFPKGAIHILPVDVFSGNGRILLAEKNGSYFIAPDNGLLPLAFDSDMHTCICGNFKTPFYFIDWIEQAGHAIGQLLSSGIASFARPESLTAPRLPQPQIMRDGIDCNVLYIDRYENVVLDVTRRQFDELTEKKPFRIKLLRDNITAVSNNYNDVPWGKPLCRFNNAGFLEIAFNHGKAATSLGLARGVSFGYQKIKIFTS